MSLEDYKVSDDELSSIDIFVIDEGAASKLDQINELVPKLTKSKDSSFLLLDFGSAASSLHKLGNISNVYYTHASSLDSVISRNLNIRRDAIPEAEKIIESRVKDFLNWSESDKWDISKSIIARSHQMQKVFELIYKVAPTDAIVIISGETGTGKELVAKAIHKSSKRGDKPFIAINCGAIPENLLESTLFGYVKGAFTGAIENKPGIFHAADGGVLFLDEIAELPLMLQVKLLRALQDNEITPVGGNTSTKVDVRVMAATNKNLLNEVKEKKFREDLYYRLNVVEIVVPPLRERVDDILALANHFLHDHSNRTQNEKFKLSDSAADLLIKYQWPGNVRELQNVIERAAVLSDSPTILPIDLPEGILGNSNTLLSDSSTKGMTLEELEEKHIRITLNKNNYNYGSVADLLGIGRTTLWRKMKKYGIVSTE
ncbi:MAG: sigma-54-dependent Fis family transcriptional regulator [Candidatus Marinimicrobia bacterium]|nr:sigma-54-dependent Fis family transcriptional regulator [Candidatus Neomarinimicrobiota bacterium]